MFRFIVRKFLDGLLVLAGVVALVFFLFQGFGDPARLVLGQTGDSATLNNIRKELALDQPKWKQFVLYLNDVSPISFYSHKAMQERGITGIAIGGDTKLVIKFPYLRRSYQS
ncbi:MAG TPA: ABC transporter permease, partial [Chitinophagaceae bacterium]|nr:ABC transporter permease [Chitinophagaceae bacterium]